MESTEDTTPWYRQFWPWFLISLPATSVIMSFYMLYSAISHPDSVVSDNYYKKGLAINSVIDDLDKARALGIKAQLINEGYRLQVILSAEKDLSDAPVHIIFGHPIDSKLDYTLELMAAGNHRFVGVLPEMSSGKWYLDIYTDTGEPWRLKGALVYPFTRVEINAKTP